MDYKPTDPRFFSLWSIKDLQNECARLNGVIEEASTLARNINTTFFANDIERYGLDEVKGKYEDK